MRPFKYRLASDGKILVTSVAVIEVFPGLSLFDIIAFAVWADHAVTPQDFSEMVDGGLLIGEHFLQIEKR